MPSTYVLPVELIEAVCHRCDINACAQFLEKGFDINSTNSRGYTILMLAVIPDEHGDITHPASLVKMVEFLIQNGADQKLKNDEGEQAVDFAKLYLDPNYRDSFGYPLELNATDKEHIQEVIELLSAK